MLLLYRNCPQFLHGQSQKLRKSDTEFLTQSWLETVQFLAQNDPQAARLIRRCLSLGLLEVFPRNIGEISKILREIIFRRPFVYIFKFTIKYELIQLTSSTFH